MIEQAAGSLAAANAALGLWMALRHVAGSRQARGWVAAHLLVAAAVLDLTLLAERSASGLAVWMVAAAIATGVAVPMTARRVPEGAGMVMLGHGAVALAATALVALWAMA